MSFSYTLPLCTNSSECHETWFKSCGSCLNNTEGLIYNSLQSAFLFQAVKPALYTSTVLCWVVDNRSVKRLGKPQDLRAGREAWCRTDNVPPTLCRTDTFKHSSGFQFIRVENGTPNCSQWSHRHSSYVILLNEHSCVWGEKKIPSLTQFAT